MRRNGSLFHTIYDNGEDAFSRELVNIAFIGTWKKFTILAEGKTISTKTLKLKKENSRVAFAFNESKSNKYDVILCQSTEFDKIFTMSFKMMKTFINIFMKDGFMVDMEG